MDYEEDAEEGDRSIENLVWLVERGLIEPAEETEDGELVFRETGKGQKLFAAARWQDFDDSSVLAVLACSLYAAGRATIPIAEFEAEIDNLIREAGEVAYQRHLVRATVVFDPANADAPADDEPHH